MKELEFLDENYKKVKIEISRKIVVMCVISPFDENSLKQLKVIRNLYDEYLDVVDFYIICSVTEEQEIEDILKVFKENEYDFNLYFDFKKVVIENYNIIAVPTVIFLDKTLNTINKIVGDSNQEEISELIEEYLDKD